MTTSDAAARPPPRVPCPSCRQPSVFAPGNRWRPFCSERCRVVDLGAWASESYRMPAQGPAPGGDDTGPALARDLPRS